jgi:hypothetical protein
MHWEISHAPLTQPITGLTRFHVKWHRDAFVPAREDRKPDWTILTTQGAGRYVGTQLHVWNPRGGWWGEGDDKFFTDGEKFPSIFGTGSEDYFGAAWGLATFDRAFHGLVEGEAKNGHAVVHRWHIADSVPFHTSFAACIEKYYPNEKPTLYDATAFWYLDPKGVDPYPIVPLGDRVGYWPPPLVRHEPGAIEGEDLVILSPEPSTAIRQPPAAASGILPNVVSGDKFLSWRATVPGEKLDLGFHIAATENVHLLLGPLRRKTGGIYQVSLDGRVLGSVDFYALTANGAPSVLVSDPIDLGPCSLTAGDHVLSVVWTGRNPAADSHLPFADFSLDYIKPAPAP